MSEPKRQAEQYHLLVEVRPHGRMPAIAILKRFLKVALRGFGVRCREIRRVESTAEIPQLNKTTGSNALRG